MASSAEIPLADYVLHYEAAVAHTSTHAAVRPRTVTNWRLQRFDEESAAVFEYRTRSVERFKTIKCADGSSLPLVARLPHLASRVGSLVSTPCRTTRIRNNIHALPVQGGRIGKSILSIHVSPHHQSSPFL